MRAWHLRPARQRLQRRTKQHVWRHADGGVVWQASAKAAVSEVQTREEDQSKQMVRSSTGGVQSQPELAALELMNKPVKEQTDQELLVTTMNRGCSARPKRVVLDVGGWTGAMWVRP
jgi:hypothetical protein